MSTTATLRARLGEQIEDYIIPGACNPPAAHRALGIDRSIGLLLPGNVVVRATPDGTLIEALDPQVMVTLTGRPELKPVADEAARRLAGALAALTSCHRLGEARHGQQRSRRRRRRPSRQFPHHVRPGDPGRPSRPRRRPPPGPRVSLDIGAPSDGGAGTWAGLTAARPGSWPRPCSGTRPRATPTCWTPGQPTRSRSGRMLRYP